MSTQTSTHPTVDPTARPTAGHRTRRVWAHAFLAAGLVVGGVVAATTLIERTEGAAEPVPPSPPSAYDYLSAQDVSSAVALAGIAPDPTSSNPDPGIAFGPVAMEAEWAAIRYSPEPGLALILSHLYPLT